MCDFLIRFLGRFKKIIHLKKLRRHFFFLEDGTVIGTRNTKNVNSKRPATSTASNNASPELDPASPARSLQSAGRAAPISSN